MDGNAAEYLCGTDPRDERSFLSVRGAPAGLAGFGVSFDAAAGRFYRIRAIMDPVLPASDLKKT